MSDNQEPTVTVDGTKYNINDLNDNVKELLALHDQALRMALEAKRNAIVNDMAVENIANKIKEAIENS